MDHVYQATDGVEVLPSHFPIPGMGVVPVNAFLIKAKEPLLVDTGLIPDSETFMDELRSTIDLKDLKWIWITHTDLDHIGSLQTLLEEAPQAKVITTFLGMGKFSLSTPLPMDRVHLLNPGQSMDLGDRTITAVKPPSFDAPETTGLYDDKSGTFFSSDCFGAVMSSPVHDLSDIGENELKEGQTLWSTVDAPWLHTVDQSLFGKTLDSIRAMAPRSVMSSHLPPAHGMVDQLLDTLAQAPKATAFVGPDQIALEGMLKEMTG